MPAEPAGVCLTGNAFLFLCEHRNLAANLPRFRPKLVGRIVAVTYVAVNRGSTPEGVVQVDYVDRYSARGLSDPGTKVSRT